MDNRWPVANQSDTQVQCEVEPDPLVKTGATLTGRGQVTGLLQFTIVSIGGHVRVQALRSSLVSGPFGQVRRIGSADIFEAQNALLGLGGEFPKGTTFEGIDLAVRGHIDGRTFVVDVVEQKGAAFQVGDKILSVGGKRLPEDIRSVRAMLDKFKPGQIINVKFERAGVTMDLDMPAKTRAAIE